MKSDKNTLLIRGGRILNPLPPFEAYRMDVLVEADVITRLSPSITNSSAQVIDAAGKIIIPGLINLHVHITRRHLHQQPLGLSFRQGAPEIENSPDTLRILWGLRNAWVELSEGVTTLRDAGSKHCVSIALQNGFERKSSLVHDFLRAESR